MMSVKEYANEINASVAEILKKCNEMGINVKTKDDDLTEDDVIVLDNVLNLITTDDEISFEENEEISEKAEDIAESTNIDDNIRETKIKSVVSDKKQKDFIKQRKQLYKHKEKLQTNEVKDDVVIFHPAMTVSDLANELNVPGAEIIKKLMSLGLMVSLNEKMTFENAEIIALDYKKKLKKEENVDISNFEEYEIEDSEKDLVKRPPVVTIMGHVDHGKTTLLDFIRHSHVVEGESGGITQHIGAYQINYKDEKITFIDTPGHAAFSEMRARGASVTDIVILIVAADDGVKPQTKEAVDHALAANVPIIVAVNKIDKPDANPEKVKTELAEIEIMPEEWGGKIPFVNVSAITGEGIDLLLENILAIAEVDNYQANPNRYAVGSVIESKIDKKIGGVASLLIQNGTLRIGDPIVVGTSYGKVRTMRNDLNQDIASAGPSSPVEITGLSETPSAGDRFMAFEKESQTKEIASKRKEQLKNKLYQKESVNLDDLFSQIQSGIKEINVVLKTDVRGSEEAVKNALEKINVEGAVVKVIRSDIGTITESDIVLATASNAIIIGFNVVPSNITKEIAKEYNVEIRLYTIIYKLVEEMELAMKGMLDPEYEESITGQAEIRQLFKFSKIGSIAGCYVVSGLIKNNSKCRLIRDSKVIYEGEISSVQREKETVKEVKKGFECGITLNNYNDIKEKDIIEAYEMVEVKR